MPDPDPFAAVVVADLPAIDEPSGRQQRIAAGLALIRQGKLSILAASKKVGIPYSTMWRFANGVSDVVTSGSDQRSKVEMDLLDLSLAVSHRSLEKLAERIDSDDIRTAELVKANQVSRDTVAMMRGWKDNSGRGDDDTKNALVAALEMMRGKRVTIEDADPADQAVDVTPKGD